MRPRAMRGSPRPSGWHSRRRCWRVPRAPRCVAGPGGHRVSAARSCRPSATGPCRWTAQGCRSDRAEPPAGGRRQRPRRLASAPACGRHLRRWAKRQRAASTPPSTAARSPAFPAPWRRAATAAARAAWHSASIARRSTGPDLPGDPPTSRGCRVRHRTASARRRCDHSAVRPALRSGGAAAAGHRSSDPPRRCSARCVQRPADRAPRSAPWRCRSAK